MLVVGMPTVLFVLLLPVAVPLALAVCPAAIWCVVVEMDAVLARLRDRHVEFWIQEGLPWHHYLGPGRSPNLQVPRNTVRQPYPSWGWMVRFALRPLPARLTSDCELVRLHRRVSLIAGLAIAGGVPLVPYAALGFWVMFVELA